MILQYKSTSANEEYWANKTLAYGDFDNSLSILKKKPNTAILLKEIKKEEKVLEGGCSNGAFIYLMRELGYSGWIGIDYSKELVNWFKKVAPKYSSSIQFGDVMDLPYNDNQFDAYFSGGVIEHYELEKEKQNLIISEAKRVVRPGGKILISVPTINLIRRIKHGSNHKIGEGVFYQTIYLKKEIRDILKKNNLKIIKEYGCGVHDMKFIPSNMHSNVFLNKIFSAMTMFVCINEK